MTGSITFTFVFRRQTAVLAMLLFFSLLAVPTDAEQTSGKSGEPERVPVTATLAKIAWLNGSWSGSGLGGQIEEHWTAPAGDSIIGMFRLVGADAKTAFCEFMMIEQEGPHVVGRFRHFGPKHKPWEPRDAPLEFDLVRVAANKAVFETPGKGSTTRLTYQKTSNGRLSINLQTMKNGVLDKGIELSLAPMTLGQ